MCHIHRLSFRIYELALPENSIYEHYLNCDDKGAIHKPRGQPLDSQKVVKTRQKWIKMAKKANAAKNCSKCFK